MEVHYQKSFFFEASKLKVWETVASLIVIESKNDGLVKYTSNWMVDQNVMFSGIHCKDSFSGHGKVTRYQYLNIIEFALEMSSAELTEANHSVLKFEFLSVMDNTILNLSHKFKCLNQNRNFKFEEWPRILQSLNSDLKSKENNFSRIGPAFHQNLV